MTTRFLGTLMAGIVFFLASPEGYSDDNTIYKKKLVKSRAEKYKDNEGVSKASRDLYIYADDDDIEKGIHDVKTATGKFKRKELNLVSPVITKDAKVRNVNIVLDAKKGITIDRKKIGADDAEVNIASPVIEKGAKVRDVNITVDAKRGGIKIK